MKRLLVFFFTLHTALLWAQTAKLQKANKYYRDLNFQQAIPLYEKILKKQTVPEALFALPECYRRIGNFRMAESWYAQASLHPEAKPEIFYYLGLMRLSNGKPKEAQSAFEKFRELAPADSRGPRLIAACKDSVRQDIMNGGALYQVSNVEALNTPFDEFGVTFFDKGFVFCSERDSGHAALRRSAWTGRPFVDIYYVDSRLVDEDKMDFRYNKPRKFDPNIQSKLHEGTLAFLPSQREVYVTRNRFNKNRALRDQYGLVKVGIAFSKFTNGKWSKPIQVAPFNNPAYSYLHPTILSDAEGQPLKMYFSSNHEGTFGGYDIFVSYWEGAAWSEPINLGPTVNTEGDEVFPFVDKDGTLYFCSDGHTGLGGFDVYFSKATRGVWAEPENVGAPINSPYDDLSFMIHPNQKFGYFASNRDGGKGNTDLYYFSRLFVQAEVLVFDKVSGKGVENINLTCECLPKKTFTTTVDGKINVQLPLNRSCRFAIENEEFQGTGIEVSTKGFPIGSMLFAQVPLEISKLDFVAQGQVVDKETNLPMSGLKLSLLSSCNKAQLSGTSDASGNFEFKLEPNCCYVVQASAEGYFTSTANFCTKGLFKSATLNPTVTMSKLLMPKNMGLDTSSIFVMDNIYYDFGKATLNEKASTGLNKLLDLLNENPDYGVEITAHTDSRGTTTNNARLSTRRAKAVADYLIKKGVAPLRVTYRGAGEMELVNGCSDGVNCSDDEHQLNRRTEFRVFRIR